MAKHSRETCCADTSPGGYCCTVPKTEEHKYHEGWQHWGEWTGNKDPDIVIRPGAKPIHRWDNKQWKENGRGIAALDFGTGFDEYDLLPDVSRKDCDENGKCLLPTWEEINGKRYT